MLRPERIGGFVKGSRERKRSFAHAHNRLTYIAYVLYNRIQHIGLTTLDKDHSS